MESAAIRPGIRTNLQALHIRGGAISRQPYNLDIDDAENLAASMTVAPLTYVQTRPGPLAASFSGVSTGRVGVRTASYGADVLITGDPVAPRRLSIGVRISGQVRMLGTTLTSSNLVYQIESPVAAQLRHRASWCNYSVPWKLLERIADVHGYEIPTSDGTLELPARAHRKLVHFLSGVARGELLDCASDTQFDEAVVLATLRLLNVNAKPMRISGARYHGVVRLAIDFIHANYQKRLTITDVCRYANVGERSLQLAFRNFTGSSVQQYLMSFRLLRAKAMLARGSVTRVRDAAVACGIPHAARFSQYYRDRFGQLPSESLGADRGT